MVTRFEMGKINLSRLCLFRKRCRNSVQNASIQKILLKTKQSFSNNPYRLELMLDKVWLWKTCYFYYDSTPYRTQFTICNVSVLQHYSSNIAVVLNSIGQPITSYFSNRQKDSISLHTIYRGLSKFDTFLFNSQRTLARNYKNIEGKDPPYDRNFTLH